MQEAPPPVSLPAPRRRNPYFRWLWVGALLAVLVVVLVPPLQRKLTSRIYRFYRHYVRPPKGTGQERTPALAGFAVRGVDVSAYQGDIDWPTVAREPAVKFAFIKATEGRSWVDPYFDQNWAAARAAGLRCGAYHFYRPNRDARQQAELFMSQVQLEPGSLPPVLDVEQTDKRSADIIRAGVRTWLLLIERHYGVKPILYTNHDFYVKFFEGHFDKYPLWLAHYEVKHPRLGRERWAFWQHSDEVLMPGIRGYVDGNVFDGTEAEFARLAIPVRPAPVVQPAPPARPAKVAGRKKSRRKPTAVKGRHHRHHRQHRQ